MIPLWIRVELGVMAMQRYSILPRSTELKPPHQIQFSVIPKTPHFWGSSHSSAGDTVSIV